ncbi:Deoxyhypusine hydroxylase [Penicillium maclennaniae]|uniref:Deoxyhypusine hydroxylase n=1 Tax=Penicillium maclennaniae TaxID=1343394 RepID=UPI00253F70D5|nr:Deoxyhypusine hydroxylase [Penicillium maclennaniae]KAJ5670102.1 Deoxyhypusine hydroxylase [Penicillium maclennaniae]
MDIESRQVPWESISRIGAGQPHPNRRSPATPPQKIDDKIKKIAPSDPPPQNFLHIQPPLPKMSPSATETPDGTVFTLRKVLTSESEPLARRFRALFSLKHLACLQPPTEQTLPAIEAIAAGFASQSALLKHELAYCLGQTRNHDSVSYLQQVVKDVEEDAMCRHEAAEALGALGYDDSLAILKKLRDDENELEIVRETCDIAVDRIIWENSEARKAEKLKPSDFTSIDPAPPMPLEAREPCIPDLEKTLLDTKLPLFQRYRAMFGLRDLASPPDLPTAFDAVNALAKGLKDPSALFRHEVAFVFGQLCHPASIPYLTECLGDLKEQGMVRHEAAEALGSLGDEEGVEETLKSFLNDPEQVVRDSVIVALDMAEFEKSGQVEYALVPNGSAPAVAAA